jgi:hypothetical protein
VDALISAAPPSARQQLLAVVPMIKTMGMDKLLRFQGVIEAASALTRERIPTLVPEVAQAPSVATPGGGSELRGAEVRPHTDQGHPASEASLAPGKRQDGGIPEGAYLDRETGLMWTMRDNGEPIPSWAKANAFAKRLRLGGHSDWRLPTMEELEALYDPGNGNDNIRRPLSLTKLWVWSSMKEGSRAWYFNFFNGKRSVPDYLMGATGTYPCALCVRRSGP